MAEPRNIFEEVDEAAPSTRQAVKTGTLGGDGPGRRRGLRIWLAVLFLLVAAMVVVGGLTRLTDSGLSITQWKPITGALPPMGAEDWQAEFDLYQQIPEFRLQNNHMDLAAFKQIYWWEWSHRLLGRLIGLVWAVGFFGLLAARRIPPGWHLRLFALGLLGGAQGAIGWWMVASGLGGERVDVASYRLATHLGLAFIILGLIAWFGRLIGRGEAALMQARRAREGRVYRLAGLLMALAFLQILLGALVAGIDAGRSFVDWPWMAGQFFPPDAFSLTPAWRNFLENPGLTQFLHRMTGYSLVLAALFVWARARRSPNPATRTAMTYVLVMVGAQAALGILTVLQAATLHVAITHQIGALITWALIVNLRAQAGYPVTTSLRNR